MVCSLGKLYAKVQDYAEENYYTQKQGLTNSRWFGHGAELLGLEHQVTPDDFNLTYQGIDRQGNSLRQRQSNRNSNPGRDLTFSAPKSVSLLGLVKQDPDVISAHHEAVNRALRYIERYCIFTRTGKGGAHRQQTDKAVVAVFQHAHNRNLEPHLHSHCLIFNQTLGQDGKWRSMDNRELYQQKMTIGMVYHHELAQRIKSLGYELDWNQDGTFEVAGYERTKLKEFSSRRQEILDAVGPDSNAMVKARACTRTRRGKKYQTAPERKALTQDWQHQAKLQGIHHPERNFYTRNPTHHFSHIHDPKNLVNRALQVFTPQLNQPAFPQHQLWRQVLQQSQGNYSLEDLQTALDNHEQLIPTPDGLLTTSELMERQKNRQETVSIEKSQPPNLNLKNTLDSVLSGKIEPNSEKLRIHQIPNDDLRLNGVVQDYLHRDAKRRWQTAILTDTNQDREKLTAKIRAGLIEDRQLGANTREIYILHSRNLDKSNINLIDNYQAGELIEFERTSKKFNRDLFYRVERVDAERGILQVRDRFNRTQELPVNRYQARQVYQPQKLEIRPGEQMRFTRTHYFEGQKLFANQPFKIEQLLERGKILIETRGKQQKISPSQLLHSDYGYAHTVAQRRGQSVNCCIYFPAAEPSENAGKTGLEQVASLTKQELTVYTANSKSLGWELPAHKSKTQANSPPIAQPQSNQQSINIPRREEFQLIVAAKYLVEQLGTVDAQNLPEKIYQAEDGTQIKRNRDGLTITLQGEEIKFNRENTRVKNTFSAEQIKHQIQAITRKMQQQKHRELAQTKTHSRTIEL